MVALPSNENGRPGKGGHMSPTAIKDGASVPRCALCGHLIYARESVAVGIGRDCRRRLRAALRGADDATRAAYAAAAYLMGVVA